MSRTKKSRKPGVGSSGAIKIDKTKLDKTKLATPKDKKPKKKSGKQSGNRQKEAIQSTQSSQGVNINKDPRLGNKSPINLGSPVSNKTVPQNVAKQKKAKQSPIAAIRTIEPDDSLEQELTSIEQDERLQLILTKQEDDITLSEEEVKYFNNLMERHQEIRAKLGWEDDDETLTSQSSSSEEELWDKFDNGNLSDYE
ncbi:MAG: GTPase-activating protein [Alteromonadaceae bacterium]|nr:GTPase-activating protein [Alteromonadaceae bacterium]